MIARARWSIIIALLALAASIPASACGTGTGPDGQTRCCKICSAGKACGDSCIAKNEACHKGAGCACNAAT